MINILSYVVLAAFVIRTIRNTLYHIFLWQNNEYRLDMLRVYLKTSVGKRIVFGPMAKIKFILLALFIFALIGELNIIASLAIWSFGALFIIEAWRNLKEIVTSSLPFPKFTVKVVLIILITLLFQFVLILSSSPRFALDLMPFMDKLLAIFVALQIGLLSIPSRIRDALLEHVAMERMVRLKGIRAVGITGSYGKSTAKEFLYQLVKDEFNVVKTSKNINKPVGIAKLILQEVSNKTEILIVEAAADKHHGQNQVTRITNMLADKLSVAVITGVNQQHLALFKSKNEIALVKYSLVTGLNDEGVAVFNVNSGSMRELVKKANKDGVKTILCGIDKRLSAYGDKIMLSSSDSKFELVIGKNRATLNTNLLGLANVVGIVVAATVASELGVSWNKIKSKIQKLTPPLNSLKVVKKGSLVLIDDTYTANPDGVIVALDFLSLYSETKILVLNPLAELGKDSILVHKNIAKYAAKICDAIILTNSNSYEVVKKAVKKDVVVVVKNKNQVKDYIKNNFKGKKAILFEGREAAGALRTYKG